MVTRLEIITTARLLLGTPFQHGARVAGVGIDCANTLAWVADQLALASVKLPPYARQPDASTFRMLCREHMRLLPGSGEPGDVLSFSFVVTQHLAIVTVLEPLTILHAYEPYGKVIEHRVDDWWLRRARDWYAFRGLD